MLANVCSALTYGQLHLHLIILGKSSNQDSVVSLEQRLSTDRLCPLENFVAGLAVRTVNNLHNHRHNGSRKQSSNLSKRCRSGTVYFKTFTEAQIRSFRKYDTYRLLGGFKMKLFSAASSSITANVTMERSEKG